MHLEEKLNLLTSSRSLVQQRAPLVIYASRTHSQLGQVVSELRKTSYRPKLAIVGSREQLCTNPAVKELKSNAAMTAVCGQLVRKNSCEQYARIGEAQNRLNFLRTTGEAASLMDIEDLVRLGNSHRACPFYLSKGDLVDAEIVIMPYNYLVDRKTQHTISNLDLNGAIVIFDEAHNVENSCGEASSTEISSVDLLKCIKEVEQCKSLLSMGHYLGSVNAACLAETEGSLHNIKQALDNIPLDRENRLLQRGEYIVNFFALAKVTPENAALLVFNLENIARSYLECEFTLKSRNVSSSMQTLCSALKTIFHSAAVDGDKEDLKAVSISQDHDRRYFRVFVEATHAKEGVQTVEQRKISYWCFNSGIALRELMNRGIHSMLLTSGTLSPLNSFSAELQMYAGLVHELIFSLARSPINWKTRM